MSHNDWQEVLAPKVQGTWNLHTALEAQVLDFFVLFGSISGVIGQIGQANYGAANSFLDASVPYRHGRGLPCSTLDIGVMGDIGYISQRPKILTQLRSAGLQILQERDLLEALHLAILRSPPKSPTDNPICPTISEKFPCVSNPAQLAVGLKLNVGLRDPRNQTPWKRDARMSRYGRTEEADQLAVGRISDTANSELASFLSSLSSDASILADEQKNTKLLSKYIGGQVLKFMPPGMSDEELDTTKAPSELGVDSLISIEFRNWWRQTLGLDITVLEVLNVKSIEELGRLAATNLKTKYLDKRE